MFKKIAPKELKENPFSLIGDKWMLITAGTEERCNTMTASWGGCHLGGARGHLLYPATAVYQGVHRPRRIFHPDLFWGGVPEGPIPMRFQERTGYR